MSKTLSTGVILAIAKTYGANVNMTAITNASEAVATLAVGHAVVVGDYLEVTSGWGLLNGRIVRVKTVATNDITFEGIDTSATTKYPATSGTGTIRRITAWDNLSQLKDISTSGGDQQYADATSLDDVTEQKIPTIRSAMNMNVGVFDDPSLAWYATVSAASDSSSPVAMRMSMKNGSKTVGNAYWSLQKMPTIAKNEVMGTQISLSFYADPVRYAS